MQCQSESIAELATALSAAQGEFEAATKDKTNPAFKSKYADLSACIDAVRPHLAKHGLAVVQTTVSTEKEVLLRTTLLHKSGQWIAGHYPIVGEWAAPQKIGSAMTYARRYTLCAMLQIAQEDDDAEAAMGRGPGASSQQSSGGGRFNAPSNPAGRIADQAARQPAARPDRPARPAHDGPPLEEMTPPRR